MPLESHSSSKVGGWVAMLATKTERRKAAKKRMAEEKEDRRGNKKGERGKVLTVALPMATASTLRQMLDTDDSNGNPAHETQHRTS